MKTKDTSEWCIYNVQCLSRMLCQLGPSSDWWNWKYRPLFISITFKLQLADVAYCFTFVMCPVGSEETQVPGLCDIAGKDLLLITIEIEWVFGIQWLPSYPGCKLNSVCSSSVTLRYFWLALVPSCQCCRCGSHRISDLSVCLLQ